MVHYTDVVIHCLSYGVFCLRRLKQFFKRCMKAFVEIMLRCKT